MYFAVLQQGGAALAGRKAEPWSKRALIDAKALPMSLALRGLQAALEKLGNVRVTGHEPAAPAVLATWHHDLLFVLPVRGPKCDLLPLAPEARLDVICRASESLGFRTMRLSFGDYGDVPVVLRELVQEGSRALLSADGPKSPGLIRPETVALAAQTGAPLIPVRIEASRVFTLPGGMRLPIPGSDVTVHYGEPIRAAGREHEAAADLARALRGHEG